MQVTVNSPQLEHLLPKLSAIYDRKYAIWQQDHTIYLNLPQYCSHFTARDFNQGIGLFSFHIRLPEPLTLSFKLEELHALRFLYCVEGGFVHRNTVGHLVQQIKKGYYAAYVCTKGIEQVVHFPAQRFIQCVGLQITRQAYQTHKQQSAYPREIEEVMEAQATPMYLRHARYSEPLSRCLQSIMNIRPMNGELYEEKARQLLDLQLEQTGLEDKAT